jgi:uncharacterized membrane protein HdeD (DUF308 family)
MSDASTQTQHDAAALLKSEGRGRFTILGIFLVLCGTFALLAPVVSTFATTLVAAIAAVIAGIGQVVHGFRAKGWGGFFLSLIVGIIYTVGGVLIWLRPWAGAIAITVMLAWWLLAAGAGEIALGLAIRRQRGWGWMIFAGLISIICGGWLIFRLPMASLLVPGFALGIALLLEGWAFLAIGLSPDHPLDAEREVPDTSAASAPTASPAANTPTAPPAEGST